jgi:phage-related protein
VIFSWDGVNQKFFLTHYSFSAIIALRLTNLKTNFKVIYYETDNGKCEIEEYINQLNSKTDKDSRIKLTKIAEYIRRLQAYGISIGKPTLDKIEGTELWELRPLRDRILFAYWKDNMFVLLHHFVKKTKKTPKGEIEQAQRNLKDWKERFGE